MERRHFLAEVMSDQLSSYPVVSCLLSVVYGEGQELAIVESYSQ
jgi:hypothetical protein